MTQNFSQGKIYKITNDFNDDVYVGSTCDTLAKRFSSHKSSLNCKSKKDRPLYVLMDNIGTDRFRIELIEHYPCQDKYQLRQREGYFIREIGTLNKLVAGRDPQQNYDEEMKAIQKTRTDKYLSSEKGKNTVKKYQEEHKELIKEIKRKSAEKHKEENTIKKKQWYESNKERMLSERKIIVKCECGCEIVQGALNRHKKTQKHLRLISCESQETIKPI